MCIEEMLPQVLALAIIERAIEDAMGRPAIMGNKKNRWFVNTNSEIKAEAIEWFTNWCDEDLEIPCTFLWCCDLLDFKPDILSKAILTKSLPRGAQRQFAGYCKVINSLSDHDSYALHASVAY